MGLGLLAIAGGAAVWAAGLPAASVERPRPTRELASVLAPAVAKTPVARRTLLADARKRSSHSAPPAPEVVDVFARALWAEGQTEGMVVDVPALIGSPLGIALLDCRSVVRMRESFARRLEADLRYDVDKMGAGPHGSVLHGDFRSLRRALEADTSRSVQRYGEALTFTVDHQTLTLWRDELVLFNQDNVHEAVDRIEGRLPAGRAPELGAAEVMAGRPPLDLVRRVLAEGGHRELADAVTAQVAMRASWPPTVTLTLTSAEDPDALWSAVQGLKLPGPVGRAADIVSRRRGPDGIEVELQVSPDLVAGEFGCRRRA